MKSNKPTYIPNELASAVPGGAVASTEQIRDYKRKKTQEDINTDIDNAINSTGSGLKDRVHALEDLGNIMVEGDSIQIANDPDAIVGGNGKVTTANAVSYIRNAVFESEEETIDEEETLDGYIVNTSGIVAQTGWGYKKYDISDYSAIKVTGRSTGDYYDYTLCLFFDRNDEPIAGSAVCTSGNSGYIEDKGVVVPTGAQYVVVNTDKLPSRPLAVKVVSYSNNTTFYKKNENDSAIGSIGSYIGKEVNYTTGSTGSEYVPFTFKNGVRYTVVIRSDNYTGNFGVLSIYRNGTPRTKVQDINPSSLVITSGNYTYVDFTAEGNADYFHYYIDVQNWQGPYPAFTFYFVLNVCADMTAMEQRLSNDINVQISEIEKNLLIETERVEHTTEDTVNIYKQLESPLKAGTKYKLTFTANVDRLITVVFFNDVKDHLTGNRQDVFDDTYSSVSLTAGVPYSVTFTAGYDLSWFHYYDNVAEGTLTLSLSIYEGIPEIIPPLQADVAETKNKVDSITENETEVYGITEERIPSNKSKYIPFDFIKGCKYEITLSSEGSTTFTVVYTTSDGPDGEKVIHDTFPNVVLNNDSKKLEFTASADANNFHVYCEDVGFVFNFQVTETSTQVKTSFDLWKDKKVVWLGTSISYGSTGIGNNTAPSYALLASKMLGFKLVNTSSPGLMIHALEGNYDAIHTMLYPHLYGSSCLSTTDYQAAIDKNLLMIEKSNSNPITPYTDVTGQGIEKTVVEDGDITTTIIEKVQVDSEEHETRTTMYITVENTVTGDAEIQYYPGTNIEYTIHVTKIPVTNPEDERVIVLNGMGNESCFPYQLNHYVDPETEIQYDNKFTNDDPENKSYPDTKDDKIDKDRYIYYTYDNSTDIYSTWTIKRFITDPSSSSYYLSWDKIITDTNADADIWIFDVLPNCKDFTSDDWSNFNIVEWKYNDAPAENDQDYDATDPGNFKNHRTTFLGSLLFMMDKVYQEYMEGGNEKIPRIILFIGNRLNYDAGKADFETLAAVWPTTIIDITGALPALVGKPEDAANVITGYNKLYGGGAHYTAMAQELLGRVCAGKLFGVTY